MARRSRSCRLGGTVPAFLTLPADGSALEPRAASAQGVAAGMPHVWSAAGELLFVEPLQRRTSASIARRRGRRSSRRGRHGLREFDPALSPDGRWLAYVSNRTGANEIWVQGYPDGVAVRVSQNGGYRAALVGRRARALLPPRATR